MKSNLLGKYLSESGLIFVNQLIENIPLIIKVQNPRKGKLGDYRFDPRDNSHQITINNDLSQDAFLFVITHEIAHLYVRINHGNQIKSHGQEWKSTFGKMLRNSIELYPIEIRNTILEHAINPKASLGADPKLYKNLFKPNNQQEMLVDSLEENQLFRIGKRIFARGEKRKIRYLCKEVRTGRLYTVSGNAVIDEIIK